MLKHETKLIDPDAEQIIAALTAATADTNKRCRARLLNDDPAKWRKFTRDAAAKPEGYAMFRGGKGGVPATQVLAAWWTDSIGRKHVVIRGRRIEHDEAKRLLHKEDLEKRPALWHAYPEYICQRTVGKVSQLVCACGCGAVGSPETLGWMGETCGPCFDRKEELGAAGLRGNFPGVLYSHREPLNVITCSKDGTRIAAREGDGHVTYWDTANRTRTTIKFSGQRVIDVAFTSDARHLVVVGIPSMLVGGLFAVFDLGTDPPTRIDPQSESAPLGWRVAALPDPDLVLFHRHNPNNGQSRIEVVRVTSGEVLRAVDQPAGYAGGFSLSPDGKQFVTCGEPAVFDVETLRRVRQLTGPTRIAAFSHDGARLIVASHLALAARDAVTDRELATATTGGRQPFGTGLGYITALAVDPGGAFVYASTFGGKVCAFDAATLKLVAVLDWHLGMVFGLAVSADGSRLFSSGGDGCVKVWPIRDLLRAV